MSTFSLAETSNFPHGNVDDPRDKAKQTWSKRFEKHVIRSEEGCWEWNASHYLNGYARIDSTGYAHRVAYEIAYGPIPNGRAIHHICGNKGCVRPDHLLCVTPAEHVLIDVNMHCHGLKMRTHCPKGHEYSEENTIWVKDGRSRKCRACRPEKDADRYRPNGHATDLFCANGHARSTVNTYVRKNGAQECRQCRRDTVARWRRKHGDARG